jgi:hypothetical protein
MTDFPWGVFWILLLGMATVGYIVMAIIIYASKE